MRENHTWEDSNCSSDMKMMCGGPGKPCSPHVHVGFLHDLWFHPPPKDMSVFPWQVFSWQAPVPPWPWPLADDEWINIYFIRTLRICISLVMTKEHLWNPTHTFSKSPLNLWHYWITHSSISYRRSLILSSLCSTADTPLQDKTPLDGCEGKAAGPRDALLRRRRCVSIWRADLKIKRFSYITRGCTSDHWLSFCHTCSHSLSRFRPLFQSWVKSNPRYAGQGKSVCECVKDRLTSASENHCQIKQSTCSILPSEERGWARGKRFPFRRTRERKAVHLCKIKFCVSQKEA